MRRCYDCLQSNLDALVWAGDVQTLRTEDDLGSLACPPKYRRLGDFAKYWRGESRAPILTLFIGGNHESSSHLTELPFGGWVAPNMFYMGRAGVFQLKSATESIRIAGLSGIYNARNYSRSHFEKPPFNESTIRSVYHVRQADVERLRCVSAVDALFTHDWPSDLFVLARDAEKAKQKLLRRKPFFREDVENGRLGNPMTSQLLENLKPLLWSAAHLHVNFDCVINTRSTSDIEPREPAPNETSCVFLSHDKPKSVIATSIWDTSICEVCTPSSTIPLGDIAARNQDTALSEPTLVTLEHSGITQDFDSKEGAQVAYDPKAASVKRPKISGNYTTINVDFEWLLVLRRTNAAEQAPMGRSTNAETKLNQIQSPVEHNEFDQLVRAIRDNGLEWTYPESISWPMKLSDASQYSIPFPDLPYDDPSSQTLWWHSILGLKVAVSRSEVTLQNELEGTTVQRMPPDVDEKIRHPRDVSPPAQYRRAG